MSDTFNHGLDAYETEDIDSMYSDDFVSDPLFHHTHVDFVVVDKTDKAYKITTEGLTIWIPKSIVRKKTYLHTNIYLSILRENNNAKA
jgi:hypothetical protein